MYASVWQVIILFQFEESVFTHESQAAALKAPTKHDVHTPTFGHGRQDPRVHIDFVVTGHICYQSELAGNTPGSAVRIALKHLMFNLEASTEP